MLHGCFKNGVENLAIKNHAVRIVIDLRSIKIIHWNR